MCRCVVEKVERAGQEGGAEPAVLGRTGRAPRKLQWLRSGEAHRDWSGGSDGGISGFRQQRLVSHFCRASREIRLLGALIGFVRLIPFLFPSGTTSVSRTVPSLLAGPAVSRPSRRTAAAVRPSSTCCLTTCGSSWSAGWRSWFSATGSAAPPVRLCLITTSVFRVWVLL